MSGVSINDIHVWALCEVVVDPDVGVIKEGCNEGGFGPEEQCNAPQNQEAEHIHSVGGIAGKTAQW